MEWSGSGSWWDVHVALGWPYSSIDATIRTPRQYPVGLGVRTHVAVLLGGLLQGDARVSPGVWAGPEWLRIYGGATFAAVPTRIGDRIRGTHIRSHIGLSIEIKGFEVEGLIEPPGGTMAYRLSRRLVGNLCTWRCCEWSGTLRHSCRVGTIHNHSALWLRLGGFTQVGFSLLA